MASLLITTVLVILTLPKELFAVTCPIGSFVQGSTCKECPPGTYQDQTSQPSCKPCPAGTFTEFTGVISERLCQDCPEDSNSFPGSISCFKCPAGQVRRCGKCKACPPGTSFSGCDCRGCSPDSFSDSPNSPNCISCPPGKRSNKSRTGCVDAKCPPGTEWNFDECQTCEYLTFRNATMDKCEPCPPRTTFLDFFAPKEECQKCPPGQFVSDVVATTIEQLPICLPCPPGRTTFGFGKVICRRIGGPCPSNFFEDKDGDCNICGENQRFVPSERKCEDCRMNEFSAGGLVTTCNKCPDGLSYQSGRCVCPEGKIFNNLRCKNCPAGTHRKMYSDNECSPCSQDEFSEEGAANCTPCPSATNSIRSMGKKCEPLPKCRRGFIIPNPFISSFNDNVCISGRSGCPKGLTGLGFVGGRFLCQNRNGKIVCPKDSIFNLKDGCLSCSIGFKLVKEGDKLTCDLCGSSSISPGGLSRKCRRCRKPLVPDFENRKCICPFRLVHNSRACTARNQCPPGTTTRGDELSGFFCSKCPAGTFSRNRGGLCLNCPVNFTSEQGAMECSKCPPGTGTYDAGGDEFENEPVGDANCVPL